VAIGASAGGLDATNQLLKALPANTGMAFVVVHHLAPSRVSMLADILARSTEMPVQSAQDAMAIAADHVYVIPAGAGMELVDGKLRVHPRRKADGYYRPIDEFFRSLAREQLHRSIGVVLSGTASDGTLGCGEIKVAGGIVYAQDQSAQEDSMPRSAIAAGCVDFVLSPEAIAQSLTEIAAHPLVVPRGGAPVPVDVNHLSAVLDQVRIASGIDFEHYKRATLLRRITRRMVLHKLTEIRDYVKMLAEDPIEAEALVQDILINVTSFFRNPEGFELLKTRVFPALSQDRTGKMPLRIWVLGCSTGEEAYSIAIAVTEFLHSTGRHVPVQIFASDLSSVGITKAREGIYTKLIEQEVSQERLRRFFVATDGGYQVNKMIRDMVVFARHNALVDPPFSHVDLISCRNMLIYLDATLQQQIVTTMHYALNAGGFLWLGPSETIGATQGMFDLLDAKFKLYQRRPGVAHPEGLGRREHLPGKRGPMANHDVELRIGRDPLLIGDPQREADRLLLSRYAPAGVLVNGDFEMLQFRGDTSLYLTPAPGRASLNLVKMLRDGLVVGVRAALLQAKRERRPIRQEDLRIRAGGTTHVISVEVIPIRVPASRDVYYMVVFDDVASARAREGSPTRSEAPPPMRGARATSEIRRLRQELAASREYLQSVIEQQEAANEELQSANEEVQSTNEELQSINEELETSKEEIQSSSEELATVNDELQTRNQQLLQSHNDLRNLIDSVQIPIVMLGPDFRIRRFTPSAERLLNLIGTDAGRPITDLRSNIEIPDLEERLRQVIETMSAQEITLQDRDGRWNLLRLRPYRTVDQKSDGVVMSFVDIDSLKQAESSARTSRDRLAIVQDDAPLGIRETDASGRLTRANDAYCRIVGYECDEILGQHFADGVVEADRDQAEGQWRRVMEGDIHHYRDEYRIARKDGAERWVEVHGYALRDERKTPVAGVAFVQDITPRKEAEAELRAADRSKTEFLALLAHELRNPLAPLLNVTQLLADQDLQSERFAELRDVLERQIRNLGRMTDDLLDVSRISQGKMQLRREDVDFAGVARRVAALFRPTLDARSQRFVATIPDHPIPVDGDPVRLEQIVDNLLTNSSKFTPAGGTIQLTVASAADDRRLVELRVKDDGIGMGAEVLARIFDPFMQADKTLDRKGGGLGLGLTLARRLVELHGGTLTAISEGPQLGSEFVVRLPVVNRQVKRSVEHPAIQVTRERPLRVMVADDNRDGAETLAMVLQLAGHVVDTVADGAIAVEKINQFAPDVVLLDIGLPGKDGFEIARELRSNGGPRMRLIAVTGYGSERDRQHAADVGIDDYFTKPMEIEPLLALLGSIGT
jgi:two-component system CheB/CheR fusion protein